MNRSPAFQFYPNDFLSDPNTLVMPAEAIGAYWLLICTCWKQDGLPVDVKKLSQIARVREKKFSVMWEQFISVCFYQDPNTKLFRHKRLDKELEKQRLNSEKHTKAANARWKNDDANAMHMHSTRNAGHMHGNALHTSSSSSSSTAVKKTVLRTGGRTADPDTSPVDKAPDTDPVERRIWKDGIDLLVKNGMTEVSARPLLGRLAKQYTKPLLAQAIAATQSENPADPKTFLIGVLNERSGKNKPSDPGKYDPNAPEPVQTKCGFCGSEYCMQSHEKERRARISGR